MIAQVPRLCRTYVSAKVYENIQMLLTWVVHNPCDGMNGKSQIQSAVRVDPDKHASEFQVLGLDVWKNLWRAVSFERSRRERGFGIVPARGCSGWMLKRLKNFVK